MTAIFQLEDAPLASSVWPDSQRTEHPPLHVLRIAQAAVRLRLAFDIAAAHRALQRELVLRVALRHLALGEQQIAPQMVDLRVDRPRISLWAFRDC